MSGYLKFEDECVGIQCVANKSWLTKTCYCCGKHFQKNEELVILICPYEMRDTYKKFMNNQVAHLDEVENVINNSTSFENFWENMNNFKKAKTEKMSEEQEKRIDIFINAAYNRGYRKAVKKANGTVSCTKSGTSDRVEYNVFSDGIEYFNRRKRCLGDSFVACDIVAGIYNEFHRLLNDGKHDDYNGLESFVNCFNHAVDTVNEMMGK